MNENKKVVHEFFNAISNANFQGALVHKTWYGKTLS